MSICKGGGGACHIKSENLKLLYTTQQKHITDFEKKQTDNITGIYTATH